MLITIDLPAISGLSAFSAASDDTPQLGWRRPRGIRRVIWQHQVCADLKLPGLDALVLALDWTLGEQSQRLRD